ncbi:MAG TPA: hypothetical protein VND45_02020 [Thermoanaerobaculia bacterium]|jgi:hypothetical protein|nr:hypothetical protein [Thermoanaerobaculia bacterium]
MATQTAATGRRTLSNAFPRLILTPPGEAPFNLRLFITAVKTDSRGRVITGPSTDPVKNIIGPGPAGERGGLARLTKVMFGAGYIDGRPDPSTRIDPNNPIVKSGSQLGPFFRPETDYFFTKFGAPQDVGTPQNLSSRNTKHLRAFWDSVPRWLHHGVAHSVREILLAPDSPLLAPGERGLNFRTVRADHARPTGKSLPGEVAPVLPTQVPVTFAGSDGKLAGDAKGATLVSLDSPTAPGPAGRPLIDQLRSSNLAPLLMNGRLNPALAANGVRVINDTHGRTSELAAGDVHALVTYLKSLE